MVARAAAARAAAERPRRSPPCDGRRGPTARPRSVPASRRGSAAISSARRSSESYRKLMRPRSKSRRPSSIRARRSNPAAAESLYNPRSSRSRYTRRDSVEEIVELLAMLGGHLGAELVGNLLGAPLRRVAVVVEAAADAVEQDVGPLADRRVREVEAGRQPEAAAGEVLRRPPGCDGSSSANRSSGGASPVSSACAPGRPARRRSRAPARVAPRRTPATIRRRRRTSAPARHPSSRPRGE